MARKKKNRDDYELENLERMIKEDKKNRYMNEEDHRQGKALPNMDEDIYYEREEDE